MASWVMKGETREQSGYRYVLVRLPIITAHSYLPSPFNTFFLNYRANN